MTRLSLLVATYNRSDYLARTLRSLAGQRLAPELFEVVVVDNNSSDDTRAVVEAFRTDNPSLGVIYVFEQQQGLSFARNRAIAESHGEWLVMLDDDIEADPGLAEAYFGFFSEKTDMAACGGKVLPLYETEPPRWRSYYTDLFIASALDLGDAGKEFPRKKYPIGANFGFRRTAVERYGGFDTQLGRKGDLPLGGEEKEFIARLRAGGDRIFYLPESVVHHIVPEWKVTDAYFDRVTRGMGASERIRTRALSSGAYFTALLREGVKWCGAAVIALGYTLGGHPARGIYLLRMRRNVTQGLLFGKP